MPPRKRKWRRPTKHARITKRLPRLHDYRHKTLQRFIKWCQDVGILLSPKVALTRHGSCANIGMVARQPITAGTRLARIPRAAVLSCENSELFKVVRADKTLSKQLPHLTTWLPLLLTLLYEQERVDSFWRPYLDIVPNKESLCPPLLWSCEERQQLLEGTSVLERVDLDLEHISREYREHALPFMERHSDHFSACQREEEQYHKMVAFVMSYSFSDPACRELCGRTVMMPVIDLLNHHSCHHAELSFQRNYLLLTAIRDIAEGEEIMNTYGSLCNAGLVHLYGFAETNNQYDKAYISVALARDLARMEEIHGPEVLRKRWPRIMSICAVDEQGYIEASQDDLDVLLLFVKLLHAPIGELKAVQKNNASATDLTQAELSFTFKLIQRCLGLHHEVQRPLAQCSKARQRVAERLHSGQTSCLTSLRSLLMTTLAANNFK